MSQVYILKTASPTGEQNAFEYRLAYTDNIDLLYLHPDTGADSGPNFLDPPANLIFGNSVVYLNEMVAWDEARKLSEKYHTFLDHRISMLEHPKQVFNYLTLDEIKAFNYKPKEFVKINRFTDNEIICTTGPLEVEHEIRGTLITHDGRRIRGKIMRPGVVCFPDNVNFIADGEK